MTAILLKFSPYIAAVLVLLGLGGYGGYKAAQPRYDRLQTTYVSYRAQVADASAAAAVAYAKAQQAQIDQRTAVETNNATIIASLQSQVSAAAADRDFANRLLAAARQVRPANPAVPAAADQHGADGSASTSGDRSLAADLGDAAGECRDAIQRYAGLQAQLKPQLTKVTP